ncbi:putative transcriptional regulator AraC family [Janthinobacterium sp. HH01]|uniref:helix-turn-helix domain-containing protein n=1 Tax=Janthinobacterium sp. HH01 TaxID=1198452 RepID=UPI0002AE9591|nr:helix-turn-helix domain-containing protein [Janthinobacterium sp. HH01]ELX12374.1 putative transcriptional regulator AraC family [Janthinobacterium sp. HH01]
MEIQQILTSISLCTAVLGLFFSVPLLSMASKRPGNAWLALFLFEFAWLALADFVFSEPAMGAHPGWIVAFHWAVAGLGPAFYCYVRALTGQLNGVRQLWHFIPQLLLIASMLWDLLAMSESAWRVAARGCVPCSSGPSLLVFQLLAAVYGIAVSYRLRRFRAGLRENYSSLAGRDLRWLSHSTALLLLLLALWIPAVALGGYWQAGLAAGRLALLVALGWYGLSRPGLFMRKHDAVPAAIPASATPPVAEPPATGPSSVSESGEKYARSGMNTATESLIGKRLAQRMEHQRDYLEPDLKLGELAERIGTSPQLLSQYLNEALGLSFFEYINAQRSLEVQRLMRDPSHAGATLLELAIAAGFNSKTTFNASFKKSTGMAPSVWRKLQAATFAPIG